MKFVSFTVLLAACAGLPSFAADAGVASDARHPEARYHRRFDPLLARATDQRMTRLGPGPAQFSAVNATGAP